MSAAAARNPGEDPGACYAPTITTLAPQWARALAAAEAVDERLAAAETAASKLYPPPWSRAFGREGDAQDLAAARSHWEAQVLAINTAFGVPALNQEANLAFRAAATIADRILATHPATVADAAFKFQVVLARCGDGQGRIEDAAPVLAFLEDLQNLAELEGRGS
jgi:hypothetical protein